MRLKIILYFYKFKCFIIKLQAIHENENTGNDNCAELSPCATTQLNENNQNPTEKNSKNQKSTKNKTIETPKRIQSKTSHKPNKLQKIDNSLDNAVEALKFVCAQKSEVNEFSIFGQHIAAQLQKLPIQESLKIQADIQNMLTSARLRIINNTPNCNNMSNTSTFPSPSEMSQDMFDYTCVDVVNTLPSAEENITIKSPSYNYEQDDSSNTITLFYNNWDES